MIETTAAFRIYFLDFVHERHEGKTIEQQEELLRYFYGINALTISNIWIDMMHFEYDNKLKVHDYERSMKGLKKFAIALHWLFAYPRNAKLLGNTFRLTSFNDCWGKALHRWVQRIQTLKSKKIKWPKSFDDPNGPTFIMSVDGVDFLQQEKQHPLYSRDEKDFSHKFHHGGCKYEIGIDLWRSKVVWISGPHRGGKQDKYIFSEGLGKQIMKGKLAITDRGYTIACEETTKKISMPRPLDRFAPELQAFKSYARFRHDGFNSRIKNFCSTSGTYFRHGGGSEAGRKFFGETIEAVIVILHYEMDNARHLFDL